MKQLYIVVAEWDYEGSTVVRAFANQASANDFRNKCAAHRDKRNWYEGEYEGDAYDKWAAENDKWEKLHPAGQSSITADSFGVYAVDFDDKEPTP